MVLESALVSRAQDGRDDNAGWNDGDANSRQPTMMRPLPLRLPPAPPAASRFRSDDLDEVRAFVRGSEGEHSRVAHRSAALGFELAVLSGSAVSLYWGRVAVAKTVRGALRAPVIHLAMPEGTRYRFGRREHVAGPRTATLVPAQWEYTRSSSAGSPFAIMVHDTRLSAEIAARRPDRRGVVVLQSRALELDDAACTRLIDATTAVADSAAARGVPSPHDEARLVAMIADLLLAGTVFEHAPAVTASRLAAVEAWIDAHLEEPITVGRLCQVAGVGERALQKAFESRRGLSPMRFVVERRLAAARRSLETAGPTGTVTDVAMRLGFHTGRSSRACTATCSARSRRRRSPARGAEGPTLSASCSATAPLEWRRCRSVSGLRGACVGCPMRIVRGAAARLRTAGDVLVCLVEQFLSCASHARA
jgi:AraC-like DNA-binding protein